MAIVNEQLQTIDIGAAEKQLRSLTQRDNSPRLVSKYPKYNERMENRAMEEVHRALVRGEMSINKANS